MPKRKLTERLRDNLHPHEFARGFAERLDAADEIDRVNRLNEQLHKQIAKLRMPTLVKVNERMQELLETIRHKSRHHAADAEIHHIATEALKTGK